MKFLVPLFLSIFLIACNRTEKLIPGKYEVADQEYSSQKYSMQRELNAEGSFAEKHVLDNCLMMEMTGKWMQDGGQLSLKYDQLRNRNKCQDSLSAWGTDTSELKIPIRNVAATEYEALLAASDAKPEKWIKWLKSE